jgi:hypothetical protein
MMGREGCDLELTFAASVFPGQLDLVASLCAQAFEAQDKQPPGGWPLFSESPLVLSPWSVFEGTSKENVPWARPWES